MFSLNHYKMCIRIQIHHYKYYNLNHKINSWQKQGLSSIQSHKHSNLSLRLYAIVDYNFDMNLQHLFCKLGMYDHNAFHMLICQHQNKGEGSHNS